jgi:hypothetical protein
MLRLPIRILLFLSLVYISACTSKRTRYEPLHRSEGYAIKRVSDNIMISRFAGNSLSRKNDAKLFSVFRAVEFCQESGFKLTRLFETVDRTKFKSVQKSSQSTYQAPVYVSGAKTSKGNLRSSGQNSIDDASNTRFDATAYGGNTFTDSTSWEEKYDYPIFDSYFSCTNQASILGAQLRDISFEDMKSFVKDLMGAVQIQSLQNDSENKQVLKTGDIIVFIDGQRIQNRIQFINAIDVTKNRAAIPGVIFRDGVKMNVILTAADGAPYLLEVAAKAISSACDVPEIKERPICINGVPVAN